MKNGKLKTNFEDFFRTSKIKREFKETSGFKEIFDLLNFDSAIIRAVIASDFGKPALWANIQLIEAERANHPEWNIDLNDGLVRQAIGVMQ